MKQFTPNKPSNVLVIASVLVVAAFLLSLPSCRTVMLLRLQMHSAPVKPPQEGAPAEAP